MCLVMKMLQIQPDKEVVVEFIKTEDYKYVRILGAFYLRIIGTYIDLYRYLEPLYNDYRKLRRKLGDGQFALTHVDEVIDELLTKDNSCDIALPRIKKRLTIEAIGALEPRKSALEDDFEEEEEKDEDDQFMDTEAVGHEKDYYLGKSPPRERDRDRKRESHIHRRDREREQDRRDRERGARRRSRRRSRDRKDRDRDGEDLHKRHARSSISPRRRGGDAPEDEPPKKKKEKKEKKDDGTDQPDPETAEANRIRASLGMKPLKM